MNGSLRTEEGHADAPVIANGSLLREFVLLFSLAQYALVCAIH